jgi:hypothetical protein
VAFVVQLDHHVGGQGGVLLVAVDPLIQLRRRPLWSRQHPRVERHEYRVQARRRRLPGALAGGGDGALADRLGVARRIAKAVAGEGLAE